MRSIIFTLVSLFAIAFASQAGAESRYCAGSCDRYSNPVYHIPANAIPDGSGGWVSANPPSIGEPNLENDYLYPPGYQPAPRHVHHRQYVSHKRHYRTHRRYRKHRAHRRHHRHYRKSHRRYREHYSHRRYARPTFHNRTKYCRDEIEWVGHGKGIRRCVWVRNDLIHRYEGHGYRRY